jgi:CRISPR-associated protein Csm1
LGSIFIKGLPEEDKNFAAYATLSFLLDNFFSGYLNTIRNDERFRDDVNILYSGGDDIFAVGRWDKLIEFAREIRTEFETFVGRPDISISGGITMVNAKFPIAKAAELAGDAEHNAKQFDGKNAFNIFGRNVSWKDEFAYVENWKNEFLGHCTNPQKPMPRSILHKIMTFAELKRRGEMKYAWHTVYFLKRFAENKNKEIKELCEELKTELLFKNKPRNYELIAIAARWAELELKEFELKK